MFRKRNILKNQRGATALEFALIAPVFFAFILAIIDIAAYFFVAGQLQHGVVQAARQIRTGNIIGNNTASRDLFRNAVCSEIVTGMIGGCGTTIRVDVRAFDSYGAVTLPASLDANSDGVIDDDETVFNTGGPSCPVIVRAFYNYSTIVPGLERVLAAVIPGTVYITSATAFRNEPFTGGTGISCATAGDLN